MRKIIVLVALHTILWVSNALATIVWTAPLQNWNIYVNNSVVYVSANNMPANCSYQRAQINTSSNFPYSQHNNKDLYAYILSASLANKSLTIVVEDNAPDCTIYGANAN